MSNGLPVARLTLTPKFVRIFTYFTHVELSSMPSSHVSQVTT